MPEPFAKHLSSDTCEGQGMSQESVQLLCSRRERGGHETRINTGFKGPPNSTPTATGLAKAFTGGNLSARIQQTSRRVRKGFKAGSFAS